MKRVVYLLLSMLLSFYVQADEVLGEAYPETVFKKIILGGEVEIGDNRALMARLGYQTELNRSKGFSTAYYRDVSELARLQQEEFMARVITQLIEMRKSFKSAGDIQVYIDDSSFAILDYRLSEEDLNEISLLIEKGGSSATGALIENFESYKDFTLNSELALAYLSIRSVDISQTNKAIQWSDVNYWAGLANENNFSKELNSYTSYYFQTDIARIILAVTFFILIIAIQHSVLIFIVWALNRRESTSNKFWVKSLNLPFKLGAILLAAQVSILIIMTGGLDLEAWLKVINTGYILVLSYAAVNLSNQWLDLYSDDFFERHPNVRKELVSFVMKAIRVIVVIVVILFALVQMNVDIKAIVASLGAGGLIIAFALKETVSNIFAYLNIMMDNVFKQSEWIKTDKVEGVVIELKVRTTRIRTFHNTELTVPNTALANTVIENMDRRLIGRRIKFAIRLGLDTPASIIDSYTKEVTDMLKGHADIASENLKFSGKSPKLVAKEDELGVKRNILVFVDKIAPDAFEVLVYCFSKSTVWEEWFAVNQDVILSCSDIAKKNGIKVAIPQSQVHIESNSTYIPD